MPNNRIASDAKPITTAQQSRGGFTFGGVTYDSATTTYDSATQQYDNFTGDWGEYPKVRAIITEQPEVKAIISL